MDMAVQCLITRLLRVEDLTLRQKNILYPLAVWFCVSFSLLVCVCFLKRFMKLPIILKCREILMFCIWLTFRIIVERLIGRVVAQLDVVNVPSVTYARLSALLALLYGYIQLYNCVSVVIVKNDGS